MANELMSTQTAEIFNRISLTDECDEAFRLFKQVIALKTALEAVGKFHEKAVLYAQLEVHALLKVCELGGMNKLYGTRLSIAKWLKNLSEEEREKYINMCAEGLTIDQVYRRQILNQRKEEAQNYFFNEQRTKVINELKTKGFVELKKYADTIRRYIPTNPELANDIIDGTRNRLRLAGGIATGEDSMMYISKDSGNAEGVLKAIKLRLNSIRRDYESIVEIINVSGVHMSSKEFLELSGWRGEDSQVVECLIDACYACGLVRDNLEEE